MYALLLARDGDEKAILSVVLQRAGLAVSSATDIDRAMQKWPERPADLIVLALQDSDLQTAVGRVRGETTVPIIVIVDRVDEDACYRLYESGADLVAQRPYSARLLISQARALLRRAGSVPLFSLPTLSIAGLTLDPSNRTVQLAGQPSKRLTHLEFRLLYTLMIHSKQILPAETIVEQVWGYTGRGDKELVRGLVRRLRTKIETDPRHPQLIQTVPGVGYSFAREDE
jgi:DNA-binding response OmpR family regulator